MVRKGRRPSSRRAAIKLSRLTPNRCLPQGHARQVRRGRPALLTYRADPGDMDMPGDLRRSHRQVNDFPGPLHPTASQSRATLRTGLQDVLHPVGGRHALAGKAVRPGLPGPFLRALSPGPFSGPFLRALSPGPFSGPFLRALSPGPFFREGRWPDLGLMPGISRGPPGLAFPSRVSIRRRNWAMVFCCWEMTGNKTSRGAAFRSRLVSML